MWGGAKRAWAGRQARASETGWTAPTLARPPKQTQQITSILDKCLPILPSNYAHLASDKARRINFLCLNTDPPAKPLAHLPTLRLLNSGKQVLVVFLRLKLSPSRSVRGPTRLQTAKSPRRTTLPLFFSLPPSNSNMWRSAYLPPHSLFFKAAHSPLFKAGH